MHTFSYDGKLISKHNLGCDCIDGGMNSEYATYISVLVDWNNLMVYLRQSFLDFELDKSSSSSSMTYYKIQDKGKVIKQ